MRAAGAADPPAAEVAHAGSLIRLVGRAAAFAAAESYARCRAGLRPSAPAIPPRSLSLSPVSSGWHQARSRAARPAAARTLGVWRRPAHGGQKEAWSTAG